MKRTLLLLPLILLSCCDPSSKAKNATLADNPTKYKISGDGYTYSVHAVIVDGQKFLIAVRDSGSGISVCPFPPVSVEK